MIDEYGKDWVIIGETGNSKGMVVPERVWVDEIVDAEREAGVPVWMKDNLRA